MRLVEEEAASRAAAPAAKAFVAPAPSVLRQPRCATGVGPHRVTSAWMM